jgi:PBSX family phage terminase large subunit
MNELVGNDMAYYPGKGEIKIWDRTIYTVGANDDRAEGSIRGMTCAGSYGDELSLWPQTYMNMLLSRMSVKNAMFFGTTNPDNPNHWIKRDLIDRKNELDKAGGLSLFHFNIDDNPYLDEIYIESLKREFTGLWYERFIKGRWCAAEGAIFDFFDDKEHVITKPPGKAKQYYVGIDYGASNPTTFILFGYNPELKPKIWAEDEYYFDSSNSGFHKTDEEYTKDFTRFTRTKTISGVYLDPSAKSLKTSMNRNGIYSFRDVDNEVLAGIQTVCSMLKSGEFAICSKCQNLIDEMYGYSWDSKAQSRGEDKPVKENDHCIDPTRYVLYALFGTKRINYNKLVRY